MNILFVTSAAPENGPFSTAEKRPPLGQGMLISLAREKGHNVFFIDNYLKPSKFLERNFLQKNKIDFFGIYSNTICFEDTKRMIKAAHNLRVKNKWNGKIIVGGPHTSVALETIPKCVDFIVQGEGEKAILDILEGIETRRVIRNSPLKDIDQLPFEPWDIFTKMEYNYSSPFSEAYPTYTLNTSRGCPFNCSFCSVGSIWGRRYTYYSAKRIVDEIEFLVQNHNAKGIYFREDNFTLNKKRVIEFCEMIIEKNIKIDWACETRVESLGDEEFVKIMASSGCKGVFLGIESVSEKILNQVNKNINLKQITQCIKLCKKYNINTYCSLITGLPGETYEDYLRTKRFMDKVKPHSYNFNVFVGIPNSPLYQEILEKKLYEYRDKQGLLYLPGYDVKSRYFYNKKIDYLNHKFSIRRWSKYDWILVKELILKKIKERFNG